MKRTLCLALCVLSVFPFTSCRNTSPEETFEMPAAASPPDTMAIDKLLHVVNELLGYEDESEKKFVRAAAEVFSVPASSGENETLYLFMVGDLEIGIFASSEKDCIVSAYVRLLFDYAMVEAHMMSFAGVFLAALEPNEYEKMLSSVLPANEDKNEDKVDESKIASGEFWSIRYTRNLMNIMPKEALNDSPFSVDLP